jgi:hypothetical protein
MGVEMTAYIERLELLGFFSGYPLIYFLILSMAGPTSTRTPFKSKLVSLLPVAYALSGTFFWGLILKNLYPDYSLSHIRSDVHFSFIKLWGLLSILFWLPIFRKKVIISLFHSLVFFYLILKTIFLQLSSTTVDKDSFKNDMKVYFDSILLNSVTFIIITILFLLIEKLRKNKFSRNR